MRAKLVLPCLLLLGLLPIFQSYTYLAHTSDEPAHMAAGVQWLQDGRFTLEPLHPPIARIMTAALPVLLLDVQLTPSAGGLFLQGYAMLAKSGDYMYTLMLSRIGILPFFLLGGWLVYRWAAQLFTHAAALWAVALYISQPILVAHAGLATTDMAYGAVFTWAVMAGINWLKDPSHRNSYLLGLSLAVMIGTKYSALVQWPAAMALIVAGNFGMRHVRASWQPAFRFQRLHFIYGALIVTPVVYLLLYGLFFFSLAPLIAGIEQLWQKNADGHAAWLWRPLKDVGVWYFFPVVFFFKTPLSFLVACLWGKLRIWREEGSPLRTEQLFPLLAAASVMLSSMPSNINIGVRHVLPMYLPLCVVAGYGLCCMWHSQRKQAKLIAAALLAWQTAIFIAQGPDRISYYNELAHVITGGKPEHISQDSDFYWGQEKWRLLSYVREQGITDISISDQLVYGMLDLRKEAPDTTFYKLSNYPTRGWVCVSASMLVSTQGFEWIDEQYYVTTIGNTLRLYNIP